MLDVMTALFPYVVALYLFDCLAPIKRGQVLFSSLWGKRFSLKGPGLRIAGLSPMGKSYPAQGLSHGFTSRGFLYLNKDGDPDLSRESIFIPYEAVENITVDGSTLKVNGKSVVELPSSRAAKKTAAFLGEMGSAGLSARKKLLDRREKETADIESLVERKITAERLVRFCDAACFLLFFQVFVYVPIIIYTPLHLRARMGMVLLFIGINYLAVVVGAVIIYRKMVEKNGGSLIMMLLSFLFFPPGAIRAISHLTKDYFSDRDYLPLAAVLLKPEDVAPLIRSEWRAVERALDSDESESREFWEHRRKLVEALPGRIGLGKEVIFVKPPDPDPEAVAYCPYCLTDYRQGYHQCADCGAKLKQL